MEKLVPGLLTKKKNEHVFRSAVGNVIQFVFIVCPSRGLPKYVKTKVLNTCFVIEQKEASFSA